MRVKDLIDEWERSASEPLTAESYSLRLTVRDAARVKALAEMYPRRAEEELLRDLLTAALDEVEEAMPYEQGSTVIAEDDQGDPIFEDTGPAARLRRLSGEHAAALLRDGAGHD